MVLTTTTSVQVIILKNMSDGVQETSVLQLNQRTFMSSLQNSLLRLSSGHLGQDATTYHDSNDDDDDDDGGGGDEAQWLGALDNTAMIEDIRKGENLTMRHMSKTRWIAVDWLHEQYLRSDAQSR